LRFKGTIHGLSVTVLIDFGSSHNILQSHLATHLCLPINATALFSIMVGNGAHIHCKGRCLVVPISLQNYTFTIPFYLFPIEGVDVILCIEWLQTLGPITADFAIRNIFFTHNQSPITLTGDSSNTPIAALFH